MCTDAILTLFQPFSVVTERFLSLKWCLQPRAGDTTRTRISYQSCGSGLKDQRKKKIRGELLQRVSQLCFSLDSENHENNEAGCKCVNGIFFLIFPWMFCLDLAECLMVIAPGEWKCKIWTEDLWWQKVSGLSLKVAEGVVLPWAASCFGPVPRLPVKLRKEQGCRVPGNW